MTLLNLLAGPVLVIALFLALRRLRPRWTELPVGRGRDPHADPFMSTNRLASRPAGELVLACHIRYAAASGTEGCVLSGSTARLFGTAECKAGVVSRTTLARALNFDEVARRCSIARAARRRRPWPNKRRRSKDLFTKP
jgi:hypothetical protein